MATRSRHLPNYILIRWHFFGLCVLSLVCVFVIALLTRAELRLSGRVLGAGDSGDLAKIFELHDCSSVDKVQDDEETRLHVVSCEPYDYLVTSEMGDGEWEVKGVERLH